MAKYTDININFTKNDFTHDVKMAKDLDAIRQSIINLCLYGPNDKPFKPYYGAGIYDLLFENLDNDGYIVVSSKIKQNFQTYEPRAKYESVTFKGPGDTNDLQIYIKYTVLIEDTPTPQTISLSLGRIR